MRIFILYTTHKSFQNEISTHQQTPCLLLKKKKLEHCDTTRVKYSLPHHLHSKVRTKKTNKKKKQILCANDAMFPFLIILSPPLQFPYAYVHALVWYHLSLYILYFLYNRSSSIDWWRKKSNITAHAHTDAVMEIFLYFTNTEESIPGPPSFYPPHLNTRAGKYAKELLRLAGLQKNMSNILSNQVQA